MTVRTSNSDRRAAFCDCAIDKGEAAAGHLVFRPDSHVIRLRQPEEIAIRLPEDYCTASGSVKRIVDVLVICPECLEKIGGGLIDEPWAQGVSLWVEPADLN